VRLRLIAAIVLEIVSSTSLAASCFDIFKSPSSERRITKVSPISSKLNLRVETYRLGEYEVVGYYPELINETPRHWTPDSVLVNKSLDSAAVQNFKKTVTEAFEFAAENYKSRRDFEFIDQLKRSASENASWSSYVVVRHLGLPGSPVVGTIRFIAAPYIFVKELKSSKVWVGDLDIDPFSLISRKNSFDLVKSLLPMEKLLGVTLPRPAAGQGVRYTDSSGNSYLLGSGVLIEPGNFAVSKGSFDRRVVLSLLSAEFYLYLFRQTSAQASVVPMLNHQQTTIYTYGDIISQRMYQSISFKNIPDIVLQDPYFLEKNYKVLATSPAEISDAFLLSPLSRNLPESLIQDLKNAADEFIQESLSEFFAWMPAHARSQKVLNLEKLENGQ
jgi:hypothetical protein